MTKQSAFDARLGVLALVAACVGAGCSKDAPPFGEETDTGTDADADADTDADSDADTDTDSDTDTADTDGCEDAYVPDDHWGYSWQQDDQQGLPWVVAWDSELGIEETDQYYTTKLEMNLQIWESYGAPLTAHTDALSGDNASWATCWYCVFLDEGTTYDKWNDWNEVEQDAAYLAYDGQIEITAIDPEGLVEGVLRDVSFREVDGDVQPIADGKEICFDEVVFEAEW